MNVLRNYNVTNMNTSPEYIKSGLHAMKLKAHTELVDETFRVSTLELDVVNYDTIAPVVESCCVIN